MYCWTALDHSFSNYLLIFQVSVLLLHATYTTYILQCHWLEGKSNSLVPRIPLCNMAETLYLLGLIPVFLYQQVGHRLLGLDGKLPFLPLLLISVYCSVGTIYLWLKYYFIVMNPKKSKRKTNWLPKILWLHYVFSSLISLIISLHYKW